MTSLGYYFFFFKGVGVVEKVGVEVEMKEYEYEQLVKTLEMFGNNKVPFCKKTNIIIDFIRLPESNIKDYHKGCQKV